MADKLWTLSELAEYFGLSEWTLYQWRSRRIGPTGLRVGGRVRYRDADVKAYLAALAEGATVGGDGDEEVRA